MAAAQGGEQGDRVRVVDHDRDVPGPQRPDHRDDLGRPPESGRDLLLYCGSLFLMSVTYSGITVTGSFGDSLGATPDPISTGPIMLPV